MNFRTWQHLDQVRFQVQVCFLDEEGAISQLYRQQGLEPIHLNFHRRPLWTVANQLRHLLPAVDIAHIFGLRANLLARPLSHFFSQAIMITGQRSVDQWRTPWHNWADRVTGRWVDLYLANCQAVSQWLQQAVRIPAEKTHTIHSGLDATPFLAARPGQIRPTLGIAAAEAVIVCLANLRPVKNYPILLQAIQILQQRGFACHLLCVGDGQQQSQLEQIRSRLNLEPFVHFLGHRLDIPLILADSDIAVLASQWEGLPGSVLEAMAAGLPVVATAVGGLPELVINGVSGFLVRPNDPLALAERLADLLADRGLGQRMGDSGRERVLRDFRIDTKTKELEQIYWQCLN